MYQRCLFSTSTATVNPENQGDANSGEGEKSGESNKSSDGGRAVRGGVLYYSLLYIMPFCFLFLFFELMLILVKSIFVWDDWWSTLLLQPISWLSFLLLVATGAGVLFYYDREKKQHIEGRLLWWVGYMLVVRVELSCEWGYMVVSLAFWIGLMSWHLIWDPMLDLDEFSCKYLYLMWQGVWGGV